MSNPNAKTPTRSTEPSAPDYAVPDPQEAWEKFDRLVSKMLENPKKILDSSAPTKEVSLTVKSE